MKIDFSSPVAPAEWLFIAEEGFLSLLALLWNSAFKWEYISFSPLLFTSLLFTAICKASSDSHLAFLHFFFVVKVFLPVSCTISGTSVHSSSVKDRNGMDLKEAEDIKKRWQENTVELPKKVLITPIPTMVWSLT